MTEHLSTGLVERFQRQRLDAGDKRQLYDHAVECDGCRKRIVDSRGEAVVLQALLDQLLPDVLDEPYHLEFEVIEGYVDDTLDRIDREIAEMHLEVCAECSAEVVDLRESLATMKAASLSAPNIGETTAFVEPTRSARWWSPIYPFPVPAFVALTILVIVGGVVLWRMRSSNQQVRQITNRPNKDSVVQGSSPTPLQPLPQPKVAQGGNGSPVQSAPGSQSPRTPSHLATPKDNGAPALVLNDGSDRIILDKGGNLNGLSSASEEDRQAVRDALLTATIKRPDVLADLAGRGGVLRGNSSGNAIKLLYPGQTVIAEDRPLLKWLPVKDATSYRVSIGDSNFHAAARSEDLLSTVTEWKPASPLKRGMVYTWIVTALKDGVEIGEPSSAPEMKFKVLNAEKLARLERLKINSKSHLALGVFYAREGMVIEAEREFQLLVQQNPRSLLAKKLLKEIQPWAKKD